MNYIMRFILEEMMKNINLVTEPNLAQACRKKPIYASRQAGSPKIRDVFFV